MKEFEANSKFSNVISIEEMKQWKGNVILEGGTGSGKTTLVLEKFVPLNKDKSFLYLCNRKRLLNQIEKDIDQLNHNNVTVKTYQWLDNCIEHSYPIKEYDYIICDEFHYTFEDSVFNELTGNSFNYIVNGNTPVIYMSATCRQLFHLFVHHEVVPTDQHYYIRKSYDYVNKFVFFKHKNDIELIIENILENTNDKIVFFTHSLDLGLKVYDKFRYVSTFYCSDNAKSIEAIKIRNKTLHKLEGNTFNSRLLITTTAMDNGINLIDRDIKHVMCSMWQVNQLEQCIGRKRIIDNNDSCSFYFYERNIGMFNKSYRYEYDKLYPLTVRKIKGMIDNLQLDHMTGYDLKDRYVYGIGFKKYLINELKFNESKVINYKDIKKENKTTMLDNYLDSIVGIKLYKDDQKELIDMIDLRVNSKQQKSYKKLNEGLNMLNLPFIILPKKSNDKRYWIVERIEK